MKQFLKIRINKTLIAVTVLALLAFTSSHLFNEHQHAMRPTTAASDSCSCYSQSPFDNLYVYFNKAVPGDLPSFNNQSQVDCFAWQAFVALNWPNNPNSRFGAPGDMSFVQWETYMPRNVLFQENGQKPPPFGTLVSRDIAAKFKANRMAFNPTQTKVMIYTSKFDFEQAAPGGKPNWLGAQNKTNLWYEVMLNRDYYDYIVKNGFYNAAVQHDSVSAGVPIVFPKGVYNGPTGAIELKAAWMEIDNPTSPKWNRYKLSKAIVIDATTGQIRQTVIALTGLHILHKTSNQPTWVWSTFEHVDNVPERGQLTPPPYGYNLNNPNCSVQRIVVKSLFTGKDTTVQVPCTPNTSPPYYLKQGKPAAIQVTRVNPIDPQDAAPINKMMQANIKQYYANSVWQYYQLIDVIWSQSFQPDPTTPINTPRPLNTSSMLSGANIVANTTMETYVQDVNTCYSCHVFGHIAPYPPDSVNNNIVGDMSFAIKFASYPKTGETLKAKPQKTNKQGGRKRTG